MYHFQNYPTFSYFIMLLLLGNVN